MLNRIPFLGLVDNKFLPLDCKINDLSELFYRNGLRVLRYNENNLKDFIVDSINNNRPVIVNVDSYYLKFNVDSYNKAHNGHSLLVYGYNDNDTLNIIEHNYINDLIFTEMITEYDQIFSAYINNAIEPPLALSFENIKESTEFLRNARLKRCNEYWDFYKSAKVYEKNLISLEKLRLDIPNLLKDNVLSSDSINNIYRYVTALKSLQYTFNIFYGQEKEICTTIDELVRIWLILRACYAKTVASDRYKNREFFDKTNKLNLQCEYLDNKIYELISSRGQKRG
jgi:hypothetical protein